jgi:uncharacterized protein (DUF1499 family)
MPMINDVTTRFPDAPQFELLAGKLANEGRSMSYPESFWAIQAQKHPEVKPLVVTLAPDVTFERISQLAAQQPQWKIVGKDPSRRRLEAIATTKWLRFKDDVVIEVLPQGNGSVVHMRSKSRLGRDDFGANANRITQFLKNF